MKIAGLEDANKVFRQIVHFLSDIPARRLDLIVTRIILVSDHDLINRNLSRFPYCSPVFIKYADNLLSEDNFLEAFAVLFISFNMFTPEVAAYVTKSFRLSISKLVGKTHFSEMIAIVFSSPEPLPRCLSPIDVFFSAIVDESANLVQYCDSSLIDRLFEGITLRKDMPRSFLRFLILTSSLYPFTPEMLWNYAVTAPTLIFTYIDHRDDSEAMKLWVPIIEKLIYLQRNEKNLDIQITILIFFITNYKRHKSLLKLFLAKKVHQWLVSVLWSLKADCGAPDRKVSFLTLTLYFCRMNETIARTLTANISIPKIYDHFIKNEASFEDLSDVFLWALSPKGGFPFSGSFVDEMTEYESFCPSTTFANEIAPKFFSLFMKTGLTVENSVFERFLSKLIEISKTISFKQMLLNGICKEDILLEIAKRVPESEVCFDFITMALSISCKFTVFSAVFKKISTDLAKTTKFITELAKQTPIVNDFLHVDSPFPLIANILNGSIVLWVRFLSSNSQFMQIATKKDIIVFAHDSNYTYVQYNGKFIDKFITGDGIEGWHMIHVKIEKKLVHFSIDLNETAFSAILEPTATITLGGTESVFDMQSFRLFRPFLKQKDVKMIFAMGPNTKEFLYRDFVSISTQNPMYVIEKEFISVLYYKWAGKLASCLRVNPDIFGSNFEMSISPPFTSVVYLRRSQAQQTSEKKRTSLPAHSSSNHIFSNRWNFNSFVNSLEAHGGISLIAHTFAEAILKHPECQYQAFEMIYTLINRFPLYHYAFMKKQLYEVLGQLLWTQTLDPNLIEKFAVVNIGHPYSTILLNNKPMLKYFVFGPVLYHCDLTNLIVNLRQSMKNGNQFAEVNRMFLEESDAFSLIIQSISNSTQHTKDFLEILVDLAVFLTNEQTAEAHIKKLFSFIMINHLTFQMSEVSQDSNDANTPLREFRTRAAAPSVLRTKRSTTSLLRCLNRLLSKYHNVRVQIDLLLGAFTTSCEKIQIELISLFLKHAPQNLIYIFGVVIQKLPNSRKLAEFLFVYAQAVLSGEFAIHNITIPLLYMASHPGHTEYLYALSSAATPGIKNFRYINPIAYEQIILIIQQIEERTDESSSILVPSEITIDEINVSATVSPLSNFIVNVLHRGLETGDIDKIQKFFITIFALTFIPDYKLATVALYLLGKIIEMGTASNSLYLQGLIPFALSFASFVFNRIHLIPGNRTDLLTNIIIFFMRQVLAAIPDATSEIANKVFDTLVEFSSLDFMSPLIIDDLKHNKRLARKGRFNETVDRLENPTSYTPVKYKKPPFDAELKRLEDLVARRDKSDCLALLTLCCNSIQYQTQRSGDVAFVSASIDTMIETWHDVFESLMSETAIFANCPIKYKLNETTTDPVVRKLLFPLNPATDRLYLSAWEEKYHTKPPELKLTMSDVMHYAPTLLMENNVQFNGDAVRVSGISMLKGVLVVTNDSIKFYQKPKSESFFDELVIIPFTQLKYIKLNMFQHQPKGVIVEDTVNGLFIFALETPSLRDRFVEVLQMNGTKVFNGVDKDALNRATQMWCDGRLCTFDYILKINFISGRTWTDFTQFPIFPWTILDFESKHPTEFRDLTLPIFAQNERQQKMCRDYYNATEEMGSAHFFPNYISNVGSSLYFLIRIEPFTDEEISFQSGSFDAADRTFQSLTITKHLMTSAGTKSSLELVPEIYLIPEIFENTNSIVFPISPINKRDISNVTMPDWCKDSPQKLVRVLRRALESDKTSESLNEWIDLIWGVRRDGQGALERFNVLQPIIFSFDPEKYMNDRIMMKAVIDQIHNCGQAPTKLFNSYHPKRTFRNIGKLHLKKSDDKVPINENALAFKIQRKDGWHKLSNGMKVRISCTSIEYAKTKQAVASFTFTDEIRPICIQTDGNDIVTGHKLPIINHWVSTELGLRHLGTMRGHMEKVSYVSISNYCKLIVAGHIDGKLSVFTVNPHRFLRTIDTGNILPIYLIIISQPTSDILVFQKTDEKHSRITLFSCNGRILATKDTDYIVRDCAATTFPEGTQNNFYFLVTKDKLISLSAVSLNVKEEFEIANPKPISVATWNRFNVFIAREDNTLSRWILTPK